MITQMTTAFAVSGTSVYIHHPVANRAVAIYQMSDNSLSLIPSLVLTTKAPDIKMALRPHRSINTHLRKRSAETSDARTSHIRRNSAQHVDDRVVMTSTQEQGFLHSKIRAGSNVRMVST
jgi:flagellar basal body P-ring protein FlgI